MKTPSLRQFPCLLLLTAVSTLSAAQTYTVTDLGTLSGGNYSVAKAINATGQITGASGNFNNNVSDIVLYSNGAMTNLGTLGGNSGIGNGINASGQVAGYSTAANGTYHAFLASGGTLTDIGDLGGGSAVAYAINDAGQVVGSAVTADGSNHPFLYRAGQMIDLGTLGSPNGVDWWNSAQGINDSGVVVGTSYDAKGNFRAFVWSSGTMTPLKTLGGAWSEGSAVNSKGQTTGIAYTKGNLTAHAFLEANGKVTDLGTIAGKNSTTWGLAINDLGVIVGYSTF